VTSTPLRKRAPEARMRSNILGSNSRRRTTKPREQRGSGGKAVYPALVLFEQPVAEAEPLDLGDRLGEQAFTTDPVARELLLLQQDYVEPQTRRVVGRAHPRGPGTHDHEIRPVSCSVQPIRLRVAYHIANRKSGAAGRRRSALGLLRTRRF
jgi:hypothetical protein